MMRVGAAGQQGLSLQSQSCKCEQAPVTSAGLSSVLCSRSLCLSALLWGMQIGGSKTSAGGPSRPSSQREARVANSGCQPAGAAPNSTSSKEEGGSSTTPSLSSLLIPTPAPAACVSLPVGSGQLVFTKWSPVLCGLQSWSNLPPSQRKREKEPCLQRPFQVWRTKEISSTTSWETSPDASLTLLADCDSRVPGDPRAI